MPGEVQHVGRDHHGDLYAARTGAVSTKHVHDLFVETPGAKPSAAVIVVKCLSMPRERM